MTGETDLFEGEKGDGERAPSPFSGAPGGATERARASIGRPPGARNRKSEAFEKWYFAMGFKDPAQQLAELMTENPIVLQAWLAEHAGVDSDGKARVAPSILEVIRMQIAAAGELMPYLHGKKPTVVELEGGLLPVLAIMMGDNQLDQAKRIETLKALSVGSPMLDATANEIKDLEGGK